MSHQEIDRLKIIQSIDDRKLSQKEAANKLNLCVRQVRRLQQRYKQDGAKAFVSKRRGKVSNNKIPAETKNKTLELIRAIYSDFFQHLPMRN